LSDSESPQKWFKTQVEPSESENITILPLGAPATILDIAGVAGQILHFHLGIHDLLENEFR
jgi:hypothetical protein